MMWFADGFHWGWVLFGGLMMLLFWGGLIALAVVIVRGFSGSGSRLAGDGEEFPSGQPSPMQILEMRYSRGEIDREEFNAIRDDLLG